MVATRHNGIKKWWSVSVTVVSIAAFQKWYCFWLLMHELALQRCQVELSIDPLLKWRFMSLRVYFALLYNSFGKGHLNFGLVGFIKLHEIPSAREQAWHYQVKLLFLWESQFLGRLIRSPGSLRRWKGSGALKEEIGVWNSQGGVKDKYLFFSTVLSHIKRFFFKPRSDDYTTNNSV